MAERDVLIVDDDAQVGDLLCQIFGAAGYPCRLVGDGGEALEVFKVWRPPLVVTDVLHPGITGIELLRQVRAVDGDVAVIVQTGAASVKTAIASLKLGAHAFIMKPVNMDDHGDRKSTRLNSSHTVISYAVFCLKKKKKK